MKVHIKDIKGSVRFSTEINTGSKRKYLLMKEDYIILKFSVATFSGFGSDESGDSLLESPVHFELGDFIDYPSDPTGLFELTDLYKPTYNESSGGYDYELRLDAYYWKWKNKKFKFAPRVGGQETSWSLTARLGDHLDKFLDNLSSFGYTYRGHPFQYDIDGTVDSSCKLVQYDNTNLIDGLNKLAESWDCEWWILNDVIHFGRCEFNDPVDFEFGVNVQNMSRSDSRTSYATRIIAFGSDRNIPKTYRKSLYDQVTSVDEMLNGSFYFKGKLPYQFNYLGSGAQVRFFGDLPLGFDDQKKFPVCVKEFRGEKWLYLENLYSYGFSLIPGSADFQLYGFTNKVPSSFLSSYGRDLVLEGVVRHRLMLPEGIPYVDVDEGMYSEELVEDIVVFDDVYPCNESRVFDVMTGIGHCVDDKNELTGETYPVYTISDSELTNFPEEAVIDNLGLKFVSGQLNGLDFTLHFVSSDSGGTKFEIVRNNNYGIYLPNDQKKPSVDDHYVLYGFDPGFVFSDMIPDAENRLLEKTREYLAKSRMDPSTYDCRMMGDYIYNGGSLRTFEVGSRVNLLNPFYFSSGRSSRVLGFEYSLDIVYDGVVYTVGESASYSRLSSLEKKVDSLSNKGNVSSGSSNGGAGLSIIGLNDKTSFTDRNVLSSSRSTLELEERSLSRLHADTAEELITFNGGAVFRSKSVVPLQKDFSNALMVEGENIEDGFLEDSVFPGHFSSAVREDVSSLVSSSTIGALTNVEDSADDIDPENDYVLVKLKGSSEWTLLPASDLGGGSSVQRIVLIQNDLDGRNLSASKGEPCLLKFTFISKERYGIGGEYEDTGERGLCQVSVKNTVNSEFTVVKQLYISSSQASTVDVSEFLTSGSNQVMIKVTGEITDVVTPAFVYTVQLTSLSLSWDNFKWWTAFAGTVTIPLNIGGNVSKSLYVSLTGADYSKSYTVPLGTAVYTETSYNYQLEHPGKSGVFNVSIYVANIDGSIRTRTISYNIICAFGGDDVKLVAINNVLPKATNWAENSLFDYSMYEGDHATTSALFSVEKEGSMVFSSEEDSVSTSTRHTFSLPLEIETIDNSDFMVSVSVSDGEISLTPPLRITVNNSLGFSSVAGAVFYMNPRTRSNNQANSQWVLNEMDSSRVPAIWRGMNWGNDGWTADSDMNRLLRVMAGSGVDIGYKVFARESARVGKTFEIDYRVDNVTNFAYPVLRISSEGYSFVGLRIFPDNVVMFSTALKNTDNQSISLFEGRRIRLSLVIMPDAYGNSGFNLCIVYVNGVKNREFTYENNDYFVQDSDILIGSDYADVDVYGIRVYDSALTSQAVLRNYLNWLPDHTEKSRVQERNDVLDGNGSEIDFENTVDQFNAFVFNNRYPSMSNPNEMPGELEVYFADHPEWNVKISNVKAKGQGTSSMRYWKWNVRFTLDKKSSVVSHVDGSTSTGGWAMVPDIAAATKITAKKNFASSMHSHKVGSVNSVEELYREMGYLNEAMQSSKYGNARVSVYQLPFVGFEKSVNDEGKEVYTFMGLYTMGPDKGDKNTFGHDTELFPGLLAIEGSDNSPLCTLFRVPWSSTRMVYNQDEESFQYNGANSWDFGAGDTVNISKWTGAYNIAYLCSCRLKPFEGTVEELNAGLATYRNEPCEFWIANPDVPEQYTVYYYESSVGCFIASDTGEGPVNLFSQLVDKGYGLSSGDLSGKKTAQLNDLFIAARIQKFRKEAPECWDIEDAILHRNWVEFHAGTDNRAKNTYPYCFGEVGSKWKWRYDDLDTIFDTDNQGQAKKGYYVEIHDKYDTGAPVWNGETSNFWNLIDLAFPDEVAAGMRKMMLAMERLSGLNSGTDFDKLYAYFQKYYFSQAQEYFPQNLYNADAKFAYENAKLAYTEGRYTNDTDPITQSQGDHYLAEQRWITKRILYMMSKYSFGLFSAEGTDNITVRAAGNTISYRLTPAMDMYPAIANGTSIIRGARTKAGEECEMLIELSGSGDQQNTIQGASYLQDIGEWYDKNVTGSMIIQGRMLRNIRLGSKTQPVTISISSLTVSNCVSLQRLDLSNITTLRGTLNLSGCTHLKEIYAGGTSLRQLLLPKGGGMELVEYSALNQYLTLQNYPLIKSEGVKIDYCKEVITDFLIENCPLMKPMELLSSIILSQKGQGMGHALKHIRAVGFEEYHDSSDVLEVLAQLADGSYSGLDSSGVATQEEIPVLDGIVNVNAYVYEDTLDSLLGVFGRLTINATGFCIRFEDAEVFRVLLEAETGNPSNSSGYTKVRKVDYNEDGVLTQGELSDVLTLSHRSDNSFSMFTEGYGVGNSLIECFDEFRYFTGITIVPTRAFAECTSLRKITLPGNVVTIREYAFSNTALEELILNEGCVSTGEGFASGIKSCKLIDFPSTITSLGTNPNRSGGSQLNVICRAVVPPSFDGNWSYNALGKPLAIYVPDESVDAYRSATGWIGSSSVIYPLSSYLVN